MISIRFNGVGKQFDNKWIFKDITLELNSGDHLAVTGDNGSGKSTFLQLLSAYLTPTEGTIDYLFNENKIDAANWFQYISCASPYMDLPEELTFRENINFFGSFKKFERKYKAEDLAELSNLNHVIDKQIKFYSSGMKQRIKLLLALTADVPVLLLDEPASNLDDKGVEWMQLMIKNYTENKLLIICSNNHKEEIFSCNKFLDINQYHNY